MSLRKPQIMNGMTPKSTPIIFSSASITPHPARHIGIVRKQNALKEPIMSSPSFVNLGKFLTDTHENLAEVVFALSVTDSPERVAPVVSLD